MFTKTNYKRNVKKSKQTKNNTNKLTPREVIELVKDSISLEAGLDRYLGINLSAFKGKKTAQICCPFHGEKTPSFTVTPNENKFKCFGCDVKGDIITLVSLVKGVSQGRAAYLIAEDFGLIQQIKQADPQLKEQIKRKTFSQEQERLLKQKEQETYKVLINFGNLIKDNIRKIKSVEDLQKYGKLYHLQNQIEVFLDLLLEAEESDHETRVKNFMAAQDFVKNKVLPILNRKLRG